MMRRFVTLDAMRAAGAGMVVLTHVGFNTGRYGLGWSGALLAHLNVGVAIFFVLSGFLLSRPWFLARAEGTPAPSSGRYLWKRALRILPLYWLVAVVALALGLDGYRPRSSDWISTLTLTQIYTGRAAAQGLGQMWSLCVEVSFYLVLPLLVRLFAPPGPLRVRRALWLGGGLSLLGLAWVAVVLATGHPVASQWLPAYLPWFLGGMVLAALSASPVWRARLDGAADLTGWWLLALGLFVAASTPITGPTSLVEQPTPAEAVLRTLLYGGVAVCLVLPLVFGPPLEGPVRRALAAPVPTALGEISYGIFAIHMVVLVGGMRLMGLADFQGHFWLVLAVTVVVSVALAALSYVLLERPIMRLRDLARRQASAGTGSSAGSSSGAVTDARASSDSRSGASAAAAVSATASNENA